MTLNTKRIVIAVMGVGFMLSLVFVQWMEVARKAEEASAVNDDDEPTGLFPVKQ